MIDTIRVVSLKCVCCGARLEIDCDMSAFACGYCGNELYVERKGGTIALRQVVDAVKDVQAGTDKIAAEMALVRLEKEREQWVASLTAVDDNYSGMCTYITTASNCTIVLGLAASALVFAIFSQTGFFHYLFKIALILVVIAGMWWAYQRRAGDHDRIAKRYYEDREPIVKYMVALDRQIESKRAIVES